MERVSIRGPLEDSSWQQRGQWESVDQQDRPDLALPQTPVLFPPSLVSCLCTESDH